MMTAPVTPTPHLADRVLELLAYLDIEQHCGEVAVTIETVRAKLDATVRLGGMTVDEDLVTAQAAANAGRHREAMTILFRLVVRLQARLRGRDAELAIVVRQRDELAALVTAAERGLPSGPPFTRSGRTVTTRHPSFADALASTNEIVGGA